MMNRRDLFKAAGAVGVGAAMPTTFYAANVPATSGNAVVKVELSA